MTYVEGAIKRYLFYSEDNSYSVIKIEILDTDDTELIRYEPTIIVCGFFPKLNTHSNYRFIGEVTHHKTYGMQFNAKAFEQVIDKTRDGIVDYLSSDIFPGVGVKTAERVVDALGLQCLDLISEDPIHLNQVKKLNDKQKHVIHEGIVQNKEMENTLVWLYSFSISPNMAMKIYQKYGLETKQIIRENPYILMDEVEGIGFKRADEIGLKVGFSYDSDLRIGAVIYYLMNEYMNKYGDTYLERDNLIKFTGQFLNNQKDFLVGEDKIIERLNYLIFQDRLIEEDGLIFLKYIYYAEQAIANKIYSLSQENPLTGDIDALISSFEEINQIVYTAAQQKAIKLALSNDVSIITGGPGTGKTTVIKGIINVYKMSRNYQLSDLDIRLAAPTGKAAKRLAESTELASTTIHKLLGYDFDGQYKHNEKNPINAKLVIIDEASMIDCLLMRRLLAAIQKGTMLILVGDANQLPSVGPGDVLNDLIVCDYFPVQKLNIIHRQAKNSNIIALAYDVLEKQVNQDLLENLKDRVFIQTKDTFIGTNVLKIIDRLIQKGYRLNDDIQVLIPMYRGQNGIDRMNDQIQEVYNHKNKDMSITYGDKIFYYQDKVMQLVNQPDKNVMNGDQGVVKGIIDDKELLVDFSGQTVKYSRKELDQLTLAYVISIHKSQGSEYPVVIMPLSLSYTIMLRRKLMYTAITRAKEMLILVGDVEAYRRGVLGRDRARKTSLKSFLKDVFENEDKGQVRIEDFLSE